MTEPLLNPLGPAPVRRLSEATRRLAGAYLTGQFRSELCDPEFQLSDLHLPAETPPLLQHARAALLIAERVPLILRSEELLVGGAPLLPALQHQVPAMGGRGSISHTTADFGDAVRLGLAGLERELRDHLTRWTDPDRRIFGQALLQVIAAMRVWRDRYRDEIRRRLASETGPGAENLRRLLAVLGRVPENPPSSFREALQSFWLFYEFQRLCGNWSGLGRFDQILGPYLEADLARGELTLDQARELVAHFWIKGTEWCYGLLRNQPGTPPPYGGDAQHYQNIILGGRGADGVNVENAVTHLVLEVVEELHISDFPVAVRLNHDTSPELLRRIAEIQLLGGGIVSVYQEEVVLAGLRRLGYPEEELCNFTNDGCWEVILPGKTRFGYVPFDALLSFQEALFTAPDDTAFEALYQRYLRQLEETIRTLKRQLRNRFYVNGATAVPGEPLIPADPAPDAVLSLVMPSCRRSGRSYTNFGTTYTVHALHAGGLPDVVNSLLAIRKLVYQEHRVTLRELIDILKRDWADAENLRLEAAAAPAYGNDDDTADAMMKRVFDDYARLVAETPPVPGVLTPAGISTFGREVDYAPHRLATAFGKHAHEYLASNLSPTPGTGKKGLTAVLNSYCKMDFTCVPNGCPLDLRLSAGIRKVADAPAIVESLLRVFLERGGFYLQIDTVDPEMLRAARRDPDRFPNLVVRISGWSARFATLSPEWQEMIINRTTWDRL